MSKHTLIFAVLYVLLSAMAVVVIDLRLVLVPTACAVVGLVVGGFIVFKPLKTMMAIPWPARSGPEDGQAVIVIDGNSCPFQGYEQDLLIEIVPRHLLELLTCFLLAVATLYAIGIEFLSTGPDMRIGAFEAELICIAGLVALLTSLRWFAERRFLSVGRIAFGSILAADLGPMHRIITYQFFDQHQERRGGRGPLANKADNVVLVVYRPADPDSNAPHGAFRFHQFRVQLLPGRRKIAVQAGADQ